MTPKYKRVVLKISGEALAGKDEILNGDRAAAEAALTGMNDAAFVDFCTRVFDFGVVEDVARQLQTLAGMGVEIGLVIGGGNIWRGRSGGDMNRVLADTMGMLATAVNAVCMKEALLRIGQPAEALSAVAMQPFIQQYSAEAAISLMQQGKVVVFACGTGLPFFSTDTVSVLRACEVDADIYMKATMTDGIYDKDPNVHADAVRYEHIGYADVLRQDLKVVDAAMAAIGRDYKKPMLVFRMGEGNIVRAVCGEADATLCD